LPFDFEEDHFGKCESDDPPDEPVIWKFCPDCEEEYELPIDLIRCPICGTGTLEGFV
jgi:hypothetical protein